MNDTERDHPVNLLSLVPALRRRLPIILLCAVLVPAAALVTSLLLEKTYSASASLLFRDPQLDLKLFGSQIAPTTSDPERVAATNLELVELDAVRRRTERRLGLSNTEGVEVTPKGQSDLVEIRATDKDPRFAARLANVFAEEYIRFRRAADRSSLADALKLVERQIRSLDKAERNGARGKALAEQAERIRVLASLQTGNAELVEAAVPPKKAAQPKTLLNTAVGGFLGIVLGLGLAFLLERLDRRLKTPEEIGETFERPILGAIPHSKAIAGMNRQRERLGPVEEEAFRMLRANLRYFNVDHEIRSVLVTSSAPGEGKSTVAMYLALAAGATGSRTLLIEADLRHPSLASRLAIRANRGLSQLLAGEATAVGDVVEEVTVSGRREGDTAYRSIDVVLSGPLPPNPTDLLESERMRETIRAAERSYDLVIIDTPPTSVVSDAVPLVKDVSGVIAVCRLGMTTREGARHLQHQLDNLGAHTLGVVVNSVGRRSPYYGYGYGYADGYRPHTPETENESPGFGVARDEGPPPLPAGARTRRSWQA